MSTEMSAELLQSLSTVIEPILGYDLVRLGLIRGSKGALGRSEINVGVFMDDYAYEEELSASIREAVKDLAGYGRAKISFFQLDPDGLSTLEGRLMTLIPPEQMALIESRKAPFSSPTSKTRLLGVSSGKGGVGKSSATVNLAVTLARMGKKVGVLDADVYGFSVPRMLGISQHPAVVGRFIIPPRAHGVSCMSVGFFLDEDTPVVWRGPMLHKALEQFIVDVFWGELDFLVIDMPPGTGDVALSLGEFLPRSEILVVTTPQQAAHRVAQRSAYAAKKLKLPIRGVIENMSYFRGDDQKAYEIFGSGGGEALAKDLEVPLLAKVPIDTSLREGGDNGVPIAISDPHSEAALKFEEIARQIAAMGSPRRYRSELKIH